jgi:DNA-directed RNA polymerase subunit RPC12/RpoP
MQIKVDCPQCGGDIFFDEELEMVRCEYCDSTNLISGKSGVPLFMLPPRWTEAECCHRLSILLGSKKSLRMNKDQLKLVYAPYWRTKGMVFHWALGKRHSVSEKTGARSWDDAKELKTRNFDFSFPAYREPDLGLDTLGIHTAALPLQLFHHSRLSGTEIVLPAEVSLQEAIEHSNGFLTFGFSDRSLKVELEDTQLVGEVYSIVYFPFWLLEVVARDKSGLLIIDGVANRIKRTIWEQDLSSFIESQSSDISTTDFGTLNLVQCTCPVCGWDLPFTPESKNHICTTCTRAWAEKNGSYTEMDYQLIAVQSDCDHAIRYMPFWNLKAQIHTPEGVLKTQTDLRKLLPAIKARQDGKMGSDSIQFLIPAFKIKDIKSISKLATVFCLRPPEQRVRAKERLEKEKFEGVYLAREEAEDMAQVVLISMVPKYHRRARKLLKDARLKSSSIQLVYYPFYRKGLYLREANSNHSIQHGTVVLSSD